MSGKKKQVSFAERSSLTAETKVDIRLKLEEFERSLKEAERYLNDYGMGERTVVDVRRHLDDIISQKRSVDSVFPHIKKLKSNDPLLDHFRRVYITYKFNIKRIYGSLKALNPEVTSMESMLQYLVPSNQS